MSINFIDILLLIGIAQGLFLTITLPIIHLNNSKPNRVLSIQLALMSVLLISKFILSKVDKIWIIQWTSILEFIIFLFGPLGYIYIQRLLIKENQNYKLPFFHYLPSISYGLFLCYLSSHSEAAYLELYTNSHLRLIYTIIEGFALISNLYYLYRCGVVIFTFEKNKKDQLSFFQPSLKFLKVICSAITVILLLWCFSFLASIFSNFYNAYINYNMVWIALPLFVYGIGFYALKQPEIFRIQIPKKEKIRVKSRLTDIEIKELKSSLNTLIQEQKVYLDDELTLVSLAENLNTSSNNLSWLLNNVLDTNFYDYINQFRVSAFIEKLNKNEHERQTLFALSLEVGFKSKSTFNKAFKANLNDTPSNYIKRMKTKSV